MNGKNKCKILKEIRSRIAQENDIPFVTSQCSYQGACSGTCPKCEQELRYLEQQLAKRQQLGKVVTVSALALGLLAGSVGCQPIREEVPESSNLPASQTAEIDGDIAEPATLPTEDTTSYMRGEIAVPTEETEIETLAGDIIGQYTFPLDTDITDGDKLVLGMIALPEESDEG